MRERTLTTAKLKFLWKRRKCKPSKQVIKQKAKVTECEKKSHLLGWGLVLLQQRKGNGRAKVVRVYGRDMTYIREIESLRKAAF